MKRLNNSSSVAMETDTIEGVKIFRKVEYRFRSGLNISNMNFNKGYTVGYDHLSPVWRSGFHFGLSIDIPLSDQLLITQEYVLTRIRGNYVPLSLDLKIDYLSIPVLLKYRFRTNTSIIFGPHFELLIDGTEINQGQVNNISKTTEERSVGITLGLEYFLTDHMFLSGRYMHGLNAIGFWQRNSRREFKFEVFQVSIGYKFQ